MNSVFLYPGPINIGGPLEVGDYDPVILLQGSPDITLFPLHYFGRKKNDPTTTDFSVGAAFVTQFNPDGTRTKSAQGIWNLVYTNSGNFTGTIRGIFNYVDHATTGTSVSAEALRNYLFIRSHTEPTSYGIQNWTFIQSDAAISGIARGIYSVIENDSTGVVAEARAFAGSTVNFGGGVTVGYSFYAEEGNAVTQRAFYAEQNAGLSFFYDGVQSKKFLTKQLLISDTAPAISSGFGTNPSIVAENGPSAFTVNVGTGGSASSGVITMPAATNGWIAHVENLTALAANRANQRTVQTASSTTSITVQNQTISTGAALAWTASDVLLITAFGY